MAGPLLMEEVADQEKIRF